MGFLQRMQSFLFLSLFLIPRCDNQKLHVREKPPCLVFQRRAIFRHRELGLRAIERKEGYVTARADPRSTCSAFSRKGILHLASGLRGFVRFLFYGLSISYAHGNRWQVTARDAKMGKYCHLERELRNEGMTEKNSPLERLLLRDHDLESPCLSQLHS